MGGVIKNVKQIGGSKYETKDGAFSRCTLRNRDGDGHTPKKHGDHKIKIRQALKQDSDA